MEWLQTQVSLTQHFLLICILEFAAAHFIIIYTYLLMMIKITTTSRYINHCAPNQPMDLYEIYTQEGVHVQHIYGAV